MRILIVEDEIGIANFLKQGLEEESYTVAVAHTGDIGLMMALSGEYDLLLLDWMLPKKSGIEICTQFRKKYKETPIIFLTAKDTLDETIFGLQAGANDYIKKPFHFEELLERVRVQLRNNSEELTELTLGSIVLNTVAHTVFKSGKEIALTQKEFDLLALLIKNKGKVCSRTKIIESVWDIHFEYNTSVIDVFINALRKKLQLTNDDNYIQTIRGVGYIAKEL
ncbi:DNA-binding response regulator [Putridiphycobacter roseus]|uniref:DNA-binding response regulator n=1 Tax=Putridiphycobacter roseus TaxID=2219161 RepID=A0A2W1N0Q8_9FLAO|nr:response regulator transcription factor [Putridiphycobacter roseus]PZE17120.1 DNA-binding response regulator [Putridiphycobacter roseus]